MLWGKVEPGEGLARWERPLVSLGQQIRENEVSHTGAESLRQEGVADQLKPPSHCLKAVGQFVGQFVSVESGHSVCPHLKPIQACRPRSDATPP